MSVRLSTRFRRPRTIVAYWARGRLLFHNFATGLVASGDSAVADILTAFDDWTPVSTLVRLRPSLRVPILRLVAELEAATLLERPTTRREPHDAWTSWNPAAGFLHFSTKDDYAQSRDVGLAEASLRHLIGDAARPSPIKRLDTARRLRLEPPSRAGAFERVLLARRTWRRFGRDAIPRAALAALTHYTFGIQSWGVTPSGERLALRTSPSGGALQPIEAYVLALRVKGLAPGLYHYQSASHELELVSPRVSRRTVRAFIPGQWWFADAAAIFLLTAVFARKQWRYRFPRAYRSVLLEAGHFAQTFCLVATHLGLAPFCTQALADRAIERRLGIDGIAESVLYATGVGPRPPAGVSGQWPIHAEGDPWSPPSRSARRRA